MNSMLRRCYTFHVKGVVYRVEWSILLEHTSYKKVLPWLIDNRHGLFRWPNLLNCKLYNSLTKRNILSSHFVLFLFVCIFDKTLKQQFFKVQLFVLNVSEAKKMTIIIQILVQLNLSNSNIYDSIISTIRLNSNVQWNHLNIGNSVYNFR